MLKVTILLLAITHLNYRGSLMKKLSFVAAAILFSASALADITPTCETFYTKVMAAHEEQAKASGLKDADIAALKQQYEASKTQMAQLPKEQQDASCKAALDAFEQALEAQKAAAK